MHVLKYGVFLNSLSGFVELCCEKVALLHTVAVISTIAKISDRVTEATHVCVMFYFLIFAGLRESAFEQPTVSNAVLQQTCK